MSERMARFKRQNITHSSSSRDNKKAVEESMMEYYERARQMNSVLDTDSDHISRGTLLGIQPQFKRNYTKEASYTRQHRLPEMARLKPFHPTIEQEYYQKTKRREEYEHPRHGNKSQELFAVMPDNVDFRLTHSIKNHTNAKLNVASALDNYQLVGQNRQNNILKQESARFMMGPDYGNTNQHVDYRSQRPRFRLDPLDFQNSTHDLNATHLMEEKTLGTVSLVKQHDINDNSSLPTDKKIQIDLGFRRKQKLLPVKDDKNNVELQSIDSRRTFNIENKSSNINLHIASSPGFLQVRAEPEYPDSMSILRLLQRPPRAKRMDLHTPDLHVIPEAGDMCVHSDNLDVDRTKMLASIPLLTRSSNCTRKDNNGRERRRKATNAEDLKHKTLQDQISRESTNSKLRFPGFFANYNCH